MNVMDVLAEHAIVAGTEGARRSSLPWIDGRTLRERVGMDAAIAAIATAMRDLSEGGAIAPQRWTMDLDDAAKMALMPGALSGIGRFGVKVLSLYGAAARGALPSHQGVMLLFDLTTGQPLCAIDAAALTALRTAAATAVATRALARTDSRTLAIIGCGELADSHIAAIRAVLPINQVRLWNRTEEKAQRLAMRHRGSVDVAILGSPAEAAGGADVICMLTASPTPLLRGADLQEGQHINLVGSSTAGPREVDDTLVARSLFFVDCRRHAQAQAAELLEAIDTGAVGRGHIRGEIGEVLLGSVEGRQHSSDVTVYKSLGHIVQDLGVASLACEE